MLTNRQLALLTFIDQSIREKGRAPAQKEMQDKFGITAQAIHSLLHRLIERGFIRHEYNRARATEVLKMPMRMLVVGSDGNMEHAGHVVVTYVGGVGCVIA